MKVVYTAGKYSDDRGDWYRQKNIQAAMDVAAALWGLGFSVICPHANTYFMGGAVPYETYLQGDFEVIRRLDALVMLPNWRESPGAQRERAFALSVGKPVFYWPQDQYRLAEYAKDYDTQPPNHPCSGCLGGGKYESVN